MTTTMHEAAEATVEVTCWCEATVVTVPQRLIWLGQTASCGKAKCQTPA